MQTFGELIEELNLVSVNFVSKMCVANPSEKEPFDILKGAYFVDLRELLRTSLYPATPIIPFVSYIFQPLLSPDE
jgi:hypothetical protein